MSDRATFVAGALTGAAVVSIAWGIASLESKPTEPPGRHSVFYDQCLASGRNTVACDAMMRVLAAEREKARTEYAKSCLAKSESKNDPFNKIFCEGEASAEVPR